LKRFILLLLGKMGYGEFIETSKSNDGGIDGIINEGTNWGLTRYTFKQRDTMKIKLERKKSVISSAL